MTVTPEQAAQALRDLEKMGDRSLELYHYHRTAPMLMLWGLIWLVGFGLSDFLPAYAGPAWLVLDVAGVLACLLLGRRTKRVSSTRNDWRWPAATLAVAAFCVLALIILQPTRYEQLSAFIALLVSLFYVLAGLWYGTRFAVTGVAVAAMTLFGYFELPSHFYLWMAVLGGGALVLAGFWLRKV